MKKILAITFFLYAVKLFAIEATVFQENYPGFQNYQLLTFTQLRNYFETLPLSALNYTDTTGIRVYKIYGKRGKGFSTLYSKIIRTKSENQISERVIYQLENGNSLEYEIIQKGKDIVPSDDLDLLTFHFNTNSNYEFYQIMIPTFKIQMNRAVLSNGEKSFFNFKFMEFNMKIESNFKSSQATLNYIYFFPYMTNPQASLTVMALETLSGWNSIKYTHLSSQAGEVTPKQFFQGIGEGSGFFSEGSKEIFKMLISLGFPSLD